MSDFTGITEALIAGDAEKIKTLVQNEVDKGADGNDILNNGLIKGMDIVGGEMFIPEVLMSANSMREAVVILKPLLAEEDIGSAGQCPHRICKGRSSRYRKKSCVHDA
jgi:5-methyltetrahydrofolate--homocysteine methyltransferase